MRFIAAPERHFVCCTYDKSEQRTAEEIIVFLERIEKAHTRPARHPRAGKMRIFRVSWSDLAESIIAVEVGADLIERFARFAHSLVRVAGIEIEHEGEKDARFNTVQITAKIFQVYLFAMRVNEKFVRVENQRPVTRAIRVEKQRAASVHEQ